MAAAGWRGPRVGIGAILLMVAHAAPAASQTVLGRVIDVETGEPISGVSLLLRNDRGVTVAGVTTGETGTFVLGARGAGLHQLAVTRLGYAAVPAQELAIEGRGFVELEVVLSRVPIALDPVTVTGIGRDPRHEATLEGMLVRRQLFPSVGTRRVFLRDDDPFVGAFDVADILRWVPPGRGCTIVYWNGRLVHSAFMAQYWLEEYPAVLLEAVEYYRSQLDAPLDMMDSPLYIRNPGPCGVVALWPRIDD